MGEKPRAGGWSTVAEIVMAGARHRPDAILLMDAQGRAISAAHLLELSQRGAWLLSERGVGRGHLVAIDATAGWIDVAVSYCAVTWLGAAAVLTTSEVTRRRALGEMGATVLVSAEVSPGAVSVSPADFAHADAVVDAPAATPSDLLDLVFTSGTTGEPKPVVSTHAQWVRSVRTDMMASASTRIVAHTGIPIAVSGGLHGVLLNHLARGVTSLWARAVSDLLRACAEHDVCELHMTPHAARAVVRAISDAPMWAHRIRVVRIIGGPVPDVVAGELARRFPLARLVSLYALTEGGAALCVKVLNSRNQDSIGRPAPGTEVRVVGADGAELPAGQVGELVMRARQTQALSYYRDESLNGEWFRDGWTRTGDMGFVCTDGQIRLVGRAKELMFLPGGRVGPEQVEGILSGHVPSSVELVVAGLRGDSGWDRIAVFLGGSTDDPLLIQAQRQLGQLRGPFRPDVIQVVAAIPRGPFGKPLRRLLVAGLAADRVAQMPEVVG
jgi:acyl-coenzyme A synthetase/AMP-(fatty) acid ligase